MSVGQVIDKATIDSQIGSFGRQLNSLFFQIQTFAASLDALADAALTVLGYSAGDIALLRSAYRDLNKFRQVYSGAYYVTAGGSLNTGVPTANDATHFGYPFSIFVNQVNGIGY